MENKLIELRINLLKADRFIKVHNDPMAAQQIIINCLNSVNALIAECEGNKDNKSNSDCAIPVVNGSNDKTHQIKLRETQFTKGSRFNKA